MVILETPRLRLRPFRAEDAGAMESVFCDPDVMRFSEGVLTPADVSRLLERIINVDYPELGFGPWAVMKKNRRQTVIGYCGLDRDPNRCGQRQGELGYRLARPYWGQGYAYEAAAAVCRYGFSKLAMEEIISMIDPHNLASIRVSEKIGMRRQGEVIFPGYDYPDLLYVLNRN